MTAVLFPQYGAFDPETVHLMGTVFEKACKSLDLSDHRATELVAAEIIYLAQKGIRDERRLCAGAIAIFRNAA
jgi:hypothetical protein